MKIARKYYGKWVATTKDNAVVDSADTLDSLMKKVNTRADKDQLRVGHLPKNPAFIGIH